MNRPTYIAAEPGDLYWRYEQCPHAGAKVLLRTVGGVCIIGHWYGAYGQHLTAWCPLPKDGAPDLNIIFASPLQRLIFAVKLIFSPRKLL